MSESAKNWTLERDSNGIAWLGLDKPDAGANVLSRDVMEELNRCLDDLEAQPPTGAVVYSKKSAGFIAGADINEFKTLATPEEAYELTRPAQKIFDRLEAFPFSSVAMISGFALGGGFELALACDYRVIVDNDKAVVGFPEVQLGIHPGFGGTVRGIRQAGVFAGMDLILTGRRLKPSRALKLDLVDAVVAEDKLRDTAAGFAARPKRSRSRPLKERLLHFGPVRAVVAGQIEKRLRAKARREHYPAPYAVVDLWRRHGGNEARMYDEEARSISQLMCTDTARNLVRLFFLQERLKGLGRKTEFKVGRLHVIGAGVMGGDIAAWCALRGIDVTLQDRGMEYIDPALGRGRKLFEKKLRKPEKVEQAEGRLRADVEGDGVTDADLVLEAIFENVEAKQDLYRSVEPRMKPGAVLATNTSSIRLEQLAGALENPNRFVGLHFFNPVAMMPLVEVIHTEDTPEDELNKGLAFVQRIGRFPLPCRSAPGFLVNRVLMPYMMEALLMAQEGVPLAVIDRIAEEFGMPMGPVELADTVGLDVALHVGKILGEAFDLPESEELARLVAANKLGKKTGHGFYEYENNKPVKPDPGGYTPESDAADRLILPLLNEAAACLREGIVADEDLLDAGVVFGTGFAPFRGGPMQYARTRGVPETVRKLQDLAERYGERFKPDGGWALLGSTD